jgi:hypothetical protein
MVCVVALLIAPGPYHRIVEHGADSGHLHTVVTIIADLALLPFALALGIDVFISLESVCGTPGAVAAGAVAAGTALALWYAMPRWRRRTIGERERMMTQRQLDQRQPTPLHVKIDQMLTEARVILPGAQALFGFQLAIVLTRGFEQLPGASRTVHAVSLGLVALAVILLIAPATYHRIVFAGEDSPDMHRVGIVLVTAATAPLALGLTGDLYVVIAKIAGVTAGLVGAAVALLVLAGLWYAFPIAAAAWRNRRELPVGYGSRPAD